MGSWSRRGLLQSAGVAIASLSGCSAASRPRGGGLLPVNNRPADEFETGVQRIVTLEDAATVPEPLPFTLTTTLVNGTVTPTRPATIQQSLVPTQDVVMRVHDDAACGPFNRRWGASTPEGVWLFHEDGTPEEDRVPNLWVPDYDPARMRGYKSYGCPPLKYPAGDTAEFEYEVWDDFKYDGYLPPDTYRFEREVTNVYESLDTDEEIGQFTNFIEITVERPNG